MELVKVFEILRYLKQFGYVSIKTVGGLTKAKELFGALKEMKDAGGMPLCLDCLKRMVEKRTNSPDAIKKSLDTGMYKEVKDIKCFTCEEQAKYLVNMKDAMGAIGKVSKNA